MSAPGRTRTFSLIRCIPHVARGEQLNVGILGWTQNHVVVDLDDRVVRENPHLATDALTGLREQLRLDLLNSASSPSDTVVGWLGTRRGYPLVATEARHTTVREDSQPALEETVERLLTRVVRPRRRAGRGFDPSQEIERRLRPFVRSNRVVRDHAFPASRSGVTRGVAYFANSTANVALDVLRLAVMRADEIVHRADAEAFKIEDILERNQLDVFVFCVVTPDEAFRDVTSSAERILESVGAVVVTDAEEAARRITRAVS